MLRKLAGTFCAGLLGVIISPQAVSAQEADGAITYKVKRGDTLIELANRYLKRPSLYRAVQKQNRISNPKRLAVGKELRFNRNLLKYTPAKARFASVRGRVLRNRTTAKRGDVVGEGAQITTNASSFVTLVLDDGSRISLPSNSQVRIRLLRRYVLGKSLDYDFAVARGGARSKVVPRKSRNSRYRVRSPKAVSAVRGTEFQMRYDANANRDFAEVVEGNLGVEAGSAKAVALPAGNGLSVAADGKSITEALLAEPELIEPGRTQANEMLKFVAKPKAAEQGYRYTIAADAGFVDVVTDKIVTTPEYELSQLDNGNYFIRVRAIAKSGLQGMPATFAFRRRLNSVKGSAGQGDDGFAFKWQSVGEGVQRYHFQMFKGSKDGIPMIDEAGLTTDSISISDLPAGEYFWRVGAVQFLDGEAATNWTAFEKLKLSN